MHKIQTSLLSLLSILAVAVILAGCATDSKYETHKWQPKNQEQPAQQQPSTLSDQNSAALGTAETNQPAVKVAILLPLSGQHEALGQSMLQAAQLAMFDIGYENFELDPKDTKGTPEGAVAAAQSALQDGAKLVLGPVFSSEVKAVQTLTKNAGVNMIAFSTDWTLANDSTYLIGFLPFDQVERVVSFSKQNGMNEFGVISPSDNYGNGVVSAYRSIANNLGVSTAHITRFAATGQDLPTAVTQFSAAARGRPYNAVLMPVGGSMARQLGGYLNQANMSPSTVRRLGTGLMDDPALASDPSLSGLWFAAPDPAARKKFERRYVETYGAQPERISSLAYDATALAAVLARIGVNKDGQPDFTPVSITNPNGFSGVDGIFRFRTDGIVERGLAVLEYRGGQMVVIDKAPTTFQKQNM